MKYQNYLDEYVKCKNCGYLVDKESLLCTKCGTDLIKEESNGTNGTKISRGKKKYR
jgi:predicted Zn-ribbon and HTH transcriptional regulator